MYLKYIEPFESTEENLKAEIVLATLDLAETYPEHFECDIKTIPKPEVDTLTFIAQMLDLNSTFEKLRENSSIWEPLRTLRVIYRIITCGRWAGDIEVRLIALVSHIFANQLTCSPKITPGGRQESIKMRKGDFCDEKGTYGRADRWDNAWI